MTPLTYEQFETQLKTQNNSGSAAQNGPMFLYSGIIAFVGILMVVWFVLNLRLKPVEKLETQMIEMQKTLNQLNAKMWTYDSLNLLITNKVNELLKQHQRECTKCEEKIDK